MLKCHFFNPRDAVACFTRISNRLENLYLWWGFFSEEIMSDIINLIIINIIVMSRDDSKFEAYDL